MKTKLGILGLGGVGGYFGGLLAKKYKESTDVEISFIVRKHSESLLKENGLKLITPEQTDIIYPDIVSSKSSEIGKLDILIIAVKNYDLINAIESIAACISEGTIILPLLNGVGAKEVIQNIFPNNLVLDGCVFVISKILEKGVIKRIAGKGALFFGSDKKDQRLEHLHQILLNAGINAKYTQNIEEVIWGKYLFISTLASLTSYLDVTTGELKENETSINLFNKLLNEFKAVSDAKSIHLSDSIIEDTIQKVKALPYETTTSMQRDFQQNKRTEYKALTEYIVDLAAFYNISVPTYKMVNSNLAIKSNK